MRFRIMLHACIIICLFTAVLVAGAPTNQFVGMPAKVSLQGIMNDNEGSPVSPGIYAILFRIWDAAEDGNEVWSSDGFRPIQIEGGLYNYLLGSSNPLPDSMTQFDSLWLGITVGLDAEMTPRTPLTSMTYAFKAAHAQSARQADTAAYSSVAETVVRSRDLYHQILDINPNSTTTIPFVSRGTAATISFYVYGSGYQGTVSRHTHSGNNAHTHGLSGTVASASVAHTHSYSGTSSSSGASHTHSGTSSSYNLAHSHTGTTNYTNPSHSHSLTVNSAGSHYHHFKFVGVGDTGPYLVHSNDLTGLSTSPNTPAGTARLSVQTAGDHAHSGSIGTSSINHAHSFTTGSWGGNHNHTLTTGNASASHTHSYSGTSGSNSIAHSHGFSGSVSSAGSGLAETGVLPGTLPADVYVYVDGVPAAGPFGGEFSTGELDLSAFVTGAGEHSIELREEGGNGGRITYNLFVE